MNDQYFFTPFEKVLSVFGGVQFSLCVSGCVTVSVLCVCVFLLHVFTYVNILVAASIIIHSLLAMVHQFCIILQINPMSHSW